MEDTEDKIHDPHLRQISLQVSLTTKTTASTTGSTAVGASRSTRVLGGIAVEELIISHANITALADKDTGFHVAEAGRADNGHLLALHVRFPANVHHSIWVSKSIFAPGVGDLPVQHRSVLVDGRPGARLAIRKADGGGGAVGDGDGDMGLNSVDPGALDAPNDQDQVFAGLVAEFVGVGPVLAKPDTVSGAVAVDAESLEGQF